MLVVEKKPSGSTPSAGAGTNTASGAPAKGGAEKSGCVKVVTPGKMGGPSEERHRIAGECHTEPVVGGYGESPDEVLPDPRERARVPALEEDVPSPAVLDALHR